jgi:hypothetical protein
VNVVDSKLQNGLTKRRENGGKINAEIHFQFGIKKKIDLDFGEHKIEAV